MNNEFWQWYEEYAEPKLDILPQIKRSVTFRKMFEYLDKYKNPIVIETGCVEEINDFNWSHCGCSTYLFDKYVSSNSGKLFSVDIDERRVENARKLVSENTDITISDSVDYLKQWSGPTPHLVFLDASGLSWDMETDAQVHHYNELKAILPKLSTETLVVVDDSRVVIDESNITVIGKGGLVAKHAFESGLPLFIYGFQVGWVGFPGIRDCNDSLSEEMLFRARKLIENDKWVLAGPIYKHIMGRTAQPWESGRQRIMHGEACVFFARLHFKNRQLGTAYDWYKRALYADPRAEDYERELIELENIITTEINLCRDDLTR